MAEYNVGYLKDEKNQIFIPYTYTQSVKIDDKGTMLDSEFNKALNNISTNKNNIDNLATTSAATYETKTDASNKLDEAKKYADKKVADLVNGAPEKLDTLEELASALGDDANFASTVVDLISTKADKAIKIIAGKGLTGGGTLSDSRTIDVGVGSGLIVTDNAIAHSNSIKAGKVSGTATQQLGFAGSFNIPTVEYDSEGHITKTSITTITLPNDAQIVANANGITDLGTRVTNEVKTLNNTINSTKTELEGKITKAQNDAATGLNNLQTSINNTLDGFNDTLSTHSDEIDDTKDRVADLETKTSIIQTLTDGTGDSAFQITDKNGNIGFQVSDGNTYSYDFILAKNGESEISLREFNVDISNRMQAAEDGIANRKTIQSAIKDPSVTNSTSDSFISNISQNTNGVIAVTKKKAILNTAGSTDTSSKIFLIGATSQAANPQTYSHNTAYVNTNGHLYSNSKQVVNLSDSQALTNKTYNGYTLADACAKGVTDSTAAGAIGIGTNLVTERDVYYGLPTINNSHAYTSSTTIYAPTSSGTKGYILKANGGTSAPTWVAQSTLEVGKATEAGTATYAGQLTTAKKINGTAFNGSADITTANWGTTRKINITNSDGTNGSTTVDVNGSSDVSLKLPTTIKANLTGNCSGSSGSCTGNAATASKLKTAQTIELTGAITGSGTFDGSAKLSIPTNVNNPGFIEMFPGESATHGGYIDFHYQNSSEDYTSRIIGGDDVLTLETYAKDSNGNKTGSIIFNSWATITQGDLYVQIPTTKGSVTGQNKSILFIDSSGPSSTSRIGRIYVNETTSKNPSTNTNENVGQIALYAYSPVAGSSDNAAFRIFCTGDEAGWVKSEVPIYGAAWNDYAEFRKYKEGEKAPHGHVVVENGDDSLSLSTSRLQKGANVCSDTYGFAIGNTDENIMPIAVAGRALVYTYEDRDSYEPGDAVCSGPNGTISKMTREEIKEYPDCIIGYVSAIPDYEIWGEHNTIVDGRIWIKVV